MKTVATTVVRKRMERIPGEEITFHPHSFADPAGRLFWWQGQLYRGIRPEWTSVVKRLFGEGVIQKLVDRGLLIETQLTSLKVDGYEMVVWHRTIPFTSYPEEWCPAMLKDAALTKIELLTELARCGFTLKDAHPWNILFDAWKPVYVDFSSIMPIDHDTAWRGYDQFGRFYLNPLMLMAHGQDRIARRLLPEIDGVSNSEVLKLTRSSLSFCPISTAIRRSSSLVRRAVAQLGLGRPGQTSACAQKSYLASLEQLKHEVEKITLPSVGTEKSGDKENSTPGFSLSNDWTVEQWSLEKILTDLRPTSVLDIVSETGRHSKFAAALGSRVVSFDINLFRITQLYYDARDKELPILPLVMDFTDPTPPRGLSDHWAVAATDRFRCEMVLALSLVHQIILKRSLTFEQIVEGLALFSKRWLLVGFVPLEAKAFSQWPTHVASSYSLDNLIDALRKRFRSVSIQSSHREPRVMLLCEK